MTLAAPGLPHHSPALPSPFAGMSSSSPAPFQPWTPARKRRAEADSPTPIPNHSSPFATASSSTAWSPLPSSPVDPDLTPQAKRRRPNLANGFSGLSISPRAPRGQSPLPTYAESQAAASMADNVDEDDMSQRPPSELEVEDVSDRTRERRPKLRVHTASSSTTSSDGSHDSASTFQPPSRLWGPAQQASEVHQPHDSPARHPRGFDLNVEDVTDRPRGKKRHDQGDEEAEMSARRAAKRRMTTDIDMEGDRSKTRWYEPEKDRQLCFGYQEQSADRPGIVITSLEDTPSPTSSHVSLEDDSPTRRQLEQPGLQGFTLSPSLLTHLLKAQKDNLHPFPFPAAQQEKGLVLYQPITLPPEWQEVVRAWQGQPELRTGDEGRFEELDEDEDASLGMSMDEGLSNGATSSAPATDDVEMMDMD